MLTGPFFIPDFGHGLGSPEFDALARVPNIVGSILKVTQGTGAAWPAWFNTHWPRARAAGGARYGSTWFRGAYVFGTPDDGVRQCDFALDQIDRAGGWGPGDMPLAWDIEGDAWRDDKALRRRVSAAFAARYYQRTGRQAMLYANGDIGIGPDDGFNILWTPHPRRLGVWPASRFVVYQYAGLNNGRVSYYDPSSVPARRGFPLRIAGWGSSHGTDMNVVLDGENGDALMDASRLREVLVGGPRRRFNVRPGVAIAGAGFLAVSLIVGAFAWRQHQERW